jgi:hypothetical protein
MMYFTLAREETNKNVEWQIAEGHLGYVDLDGFLVRTTHGHSIRYAGGVYGSGPAREQGYRSMGCRPQSRPDHIRALPQLRLAAWGSLRRQWQRDWT